MNSASEKPREAHGAMAEMIGRAWVIINPSARGGRGVQAIRRLEAERRAAAPDWTLRVSMRPGGVGLLVREAIRNHAPVVLVAGGDGAVHEAVNAILAWPEDRRPALGVIPLGTGNDFAKMAGTPPGVDDALDALRRGQIAMIDVGRAGERWFVNDMGAGLISEATRAYHNLPKAVHGTTRYVAAAFRAIMGTWEAAIQVTCDGELFFEGPFSILAVSNGQWSGGRFHLNPRADVTDGLLDVCVAHPMPRARLILNLPRLMRGKHFEQPGVFHCKATSITLRSSDLNIFQCDGELLDFPREDLKIEISPKSLRVVMGPWLP